MKRFVNHLPSPAMVVALVALVVAMGGGAYAAIKLPANSVGTKQVKKGAVTTAKVKDGSLRKRDFAAGQIPQGAQGAKGDKGDKGDAGPAGSARAYGTVRPNGTFFRSKNVASITNPVTGVYCITPDPSIDPSTAVLVVSPDYDNDDTQFTAGGDQAIVEWDSNGCATGALKVRTAVRTTSSVGSPDGDVRTVTNLIKNEAFSFVVP